MERPVDVLIVGAGISGLAAAAELGNHGLSVLLLEARNRVGGRIFTHREPHFEAPIELGAEFVHGEPAEIWNFFRRGTSALVNVHGDNWCSSDGVLSPCDFFDQVDHILKKMDDRQPDESFSDFLTRCCPTSVTDPKLEKTKKRATAYVSGFNAADPDLVGVHWLVESMRAEERIHGDRVFRPRNGYAELVDILQKELAANRVLVRTNAVVTGITWKAGSVELKALTAYGHEKFVARRALVTVPLAVLQAPPGENGAIHFSPPLPGEKLDALGKLEMGKVIRVVFRFRSRFWERISPSRKKTLSNMSFLFTEDDTIPTFWTRAPEDSPIITAWAPFRSAERLSGRKQSFVIEEGLATLARVLNVPRKNIDSEFVSAHFHDWQADRFSRGAYSYGKVGSDGAQQALAAPIAHTLFFAGEATDISGNNGTVHGAIASGQRAAREIKDSFGHNIVAG
jgi:monoamine oxidase